MNPEVRKGQPPLKLNPVEAPEKIILGREGTAGIPAPLVEVCALQKAEIAAFVNANSTFQIFFKTPLHTGNFPKTSGSVEGNTLRVKRASHEDLLLDLDNLSCLHLRKVNS